MSGKTLIITGTIAIALSILVSVVAVYSSFKGMQGAASAGISAVSRGIEIGLISSVVGVLGFVILMIGVVKIAVNDKKRQTLK